MKLLTLSNYILASHAFLAVYLFNAFSNNDNFYAAMQSLAVQKPAVVAIYNYCFILFLGFCELIMIIFFGQLRHMEIEQVVEQGRGFFMDAVLFLVLSKPLINGREIDTLKLLKCLCCLIALKGYHLVLFIRSLHTGIPKLTTVLRNLVVMYVLTIIDLSLIYIFYSMCTGKSTFYMWLLFECIGMFQGVISCILKYMINLADIILIHGLSQKPTYIFYLDLIHDFISLTIFIGFMTVFFLLNPTSLPLYMVVDAMQVIRNLAGRMATLFKYRKLTKIIEIRFPNATTEQAEAQDTCIICREKLDESCKSLDCSHVFHYQCLKSWLIHQISCPLCRKEIVYMDPLELIEELYISGNTDTLLKKIIETAINRDPFEEFNLYFQGNLNDLVQLEDSSQPVEDLSPFVDAPITSSVPPAQDFAMVHDIEQLEDLAMIHEENITENVITPTDDAPSINTIPIVDAKTVENVPIVDENGHKVDENGPTVEDIAQVKDVKMVQNVPNDVQNVQNVQTTSNLNEFELFRDLKEAYQAMIVSVDTCIDLINKFSSLDPQSPGFESALEVISLDQFERYILLSELPEFPENTTEISNGEDNILTNVAKFEKKMNFPLKITVKPYMASILGYRMKVIDSMVRAVKTITSESE